MKYQNQFTSVQLLSRVCLFATAWTIAHQASLSITNSWSLLKLMSIESVTHPTISSSVVPSSSCLQFFPASGSFLISQLFASGGQSIGALASASALPMNIQDCFPSGFTGLISLQSFKVLMIIFGFCLFSGYPVACRILVPNQRLNPGPQ